MTNTKSGSVSITYRAAFIGNAVLTSPQHAHLDDQGIMAEAEAECQRAGIDPIGIEIGDWTGLTYPDFYNGLSTVFDAIADMESEGFEFNSANPDNLISAADSVCSITLSKGQAGYLLAAIKNWADCTTDNDSWHARKAVLHPSER